MNARPALEASQIDPKAAAKIAEFQADVLRDVKEAVARGGVVVVGMAQNPHVKNVRNALDDAGVPFTYLEYGSYFSAWRSASASSLVGLADVPASVRARGAPRRGGSSPRPPSPTARSQAGSAAVVERRLAARHRAART